MKKVAAFIVLALVVACAPPPPTTLKDDVPSGCIESRAAYNGYRLACKVTGCPAADLSRAEVIQNEAKNFCVANPPSTAENVAKIQDLVRQQRAVGR